MYWNQLFLFRSVKTQNNREVKKLPVVFQKYGYRYVQLRRSAKKAIYGIYEGDRLIEYEVIKIRIRLKRFNQLLNRIEYEKEVYPSKGQWGISGWSLFSWEKALEKYNQI